MSNLPLATIDQFINFGLSIVTMQISKKPFFLEPKVLFYLRIVFIISILLQIIGYVVIRIRIKKVNDQRTLKIKKEGSLFQENPDVEEEIEITYVDYDLKELNKAGNSTLLQGVVSVFLHLKWGILQPVLIAGTIPIRNCFLNPLYKRYIFGREILRPLEANTLFAKSETQEAVAYKKRKKEE